ncbi:MAG: hypothetical protein EPO07_01735 [Verrucomicrobia bacterium]|nr:MAG: hypothetical protein EPO07_01735 [Verrucomicrobiota bacterium]
MKASVGKWEKIPTPGHRPDELWQKFPTKDGYKAWTQAHLGEVVEVRNGDAVNIGKCKICGGSSQVSCKTCGGRGLVKCPICDGKTYVPEDWTAFDNPRLKDRPSRFKLKDGRELIGRKISAIGSSLRIRTATNEVGLDASEIASEEKQPGAK